MRRSPQDPDLLADPAARVILAWRRTPAGIAATSPTAALWRLLRHGLLRGDRVLMCQCLLHYYAGNQRLPGTGHRIVKDRDASLAVLIYLRGLETPTGLPRVKQRWPWKRLAALAMAASQIPGENPAAWNVFASRDRVSRAVRRAEADGPFLIPIPEATDRMFDSFVSAVTAGGR